MPSIAVSVDGTSQAVTVAATRPLTSSFWYSKLPDNTALYASSAAVVAEMVRQSKILSPVVNVGTWTVEPCIVPVDQPLIPVTCNHDSTTQAIGAGGLPIPPSLTPTADSDAAIIIYQPDASHGGFTGWYWELQGYHPPTTTTQASCNFLARKAGVNTRTEGHFVNWTSSGFDWQNPGHTYSTYELASWGIQGSGLPYHPGVVKLEDVQHGVVDHALLIEVYDAAAGAHVWPAARGDGGAGSTNPAFVISEGMWLRLPAGYAIPTALSRTTQLYMQAARDYGLLITDRTLSCLGVRATPACQPLIDDAHLTGFPWQDLQCLAVGSDTTWHPTA